MNFAQKMTLLLTTGVTMLAACTSEPSQSEQIQQALSKQITKNKIVDLKADSLQADSIKKAIAPDLKAFAEICEEIRNDPSYSKNEEAEQVTLKFRHLSENFLKDHPETHPVLKTQMQKGHDNVYGLHACTSLNGNTYILN